MVSPAAVISPCGVDSFSCGIVPAWPAGYWRWDALMGPRMSDPLDDPPDSQEGAAGPQQTVFGGASPLTNQVKRVVGTKALMALTCSESHIQTPFSPEKRLFFPRGSTFKSHRFVPLIRLSFLSMAYCTFLYNVCSYPTIFFFGNSGAEAPV